MTNGVNREHGPYRRPVGGSRTVVSSQTTSRWPRATVARYACGAERSLLGSPHGCSLARSAVSLSVLSDLSSALPTMAAQRPANSLAAKAGRRFTRPGEARSERILHRRQLQRGEKRGSSVGPTKRGKGSKIMAIADGHGFPLSVYVALNIILGETWPSRPFSDKDYFDHDLGREIHIQVFFRNALTSDPDVRGFWLRCAARQSPEFIAIDADGNACAWGRGNPKRVSGAMREEVALLYLGLDREAETQLRSNQWTLYGKLIRRIEAGIAAVTKNFFTADVTAAYQIACSHPWQRHKQSWMTSFGDRRV